MTRCQTKMSHRAIAAVILSFVSSFRSSQHSVQVFGSSIRRLFLLTCSSGRHHSGGAGRVQGGDVGTQYRSGIYTTSAEQQAAAEAAIERLNDKLGVGAPPVRLLPSEVCQVGNLWKMAAVRTAQPCRSEQRTAALRAARCCVSSLPRTVFNNAHWNRCTARTVRCVSSTVGSQPRPQGFTSPAGAGPARTLM